MTTLWQTVRTTPVLWLLAFVPALFIAELLRPEAHAMLFVLSILAIVPLAALLSQATESVAERTGDGVGGLLNASLGNLTELIIALSALKAGQYLLVKAMIVGSIVGGALFMLGLSFFLGGLRHHLQEFNRANARMQAAMVFLATVALLAPSAYAQTGSSPEVDAFIQELSLGLAVLLIVSYGLGIYFTLGTHRETFATASAEGEHATPWPLGMSLAVLAVVTVVVALVSEVFVGSLEAAASTFGMSPAFVGFVVVALIGTAAEVFAAVAAARKDRLDLSVGIALGSAAQVALFVAPAMLLLSYLIGPTPMTLQFWPGAIVMMAVAAFTTVLVTSGGRSAWYLGVLMLMVYLVFAMTLFLLPPKAA